MTLDDLLALPLFAAGPPDPRRLARLGLLSTPWCRGLDALKVTGSNGKGSVAAMTAAILTASSRPGAGVRVGLTTSPHLLDFRERIRVGGRMIGEDELEDVLRGLGRLDGWTFFEGVTAAALAHFNATRPDTVVAEAGLGGRYDPSRIFPGRRAALVSLDLEHTAVLGHSLEEIARDKAHLASDVGVLFVGADVPEEIVALLRETCGRRGVEVRRPSAAVRRTRYAGGRMAVDLEHDRHLWEDVEVALPGEHQARNAALAVTLAADWLREHRPGAVLEDAVREGLATLEWPCRLERVARDPDVWVDAAHTPRAVAALADAVPRLVGRRLVLLAGVSADKDPAALVGPLLPLASRVLVSRARHRGMPPEKVAERLRPLASVPLTVVEDLGEALEVARGAGRAVLVAGGLFLAAEARAALNDEINEKR